MISSLIESEDTYKDPILTKKILDGLSIEQHNRLENGQCLFNPATGDMIVPMVTQNQIAKVIINIF